MAVENINIEGLSEEETNIQVSSYPSLQFGRLVRARVIFKSSAMSTTKLYEQPTYSALSARA